MKEFEQAKKAYKNTPVPDELSERVNEGIRQGKASYRKRRLKRIIKRSAGAVAACLVVMAGVLNLMPDVAAAAADVPVLGGLFRVMTFTQYNLSEDGINYRVSIPNLETKADSALAEQVNAVIQEKIDSHLEKARQDWSEYKGAFFATGGTSEEWKDREMDAIVDYDIKSQTGTQVSFVVTLAEGWVSSMEERYYYNLDIAEDRDITLADMLGKNWVRKCNESINASIAERAEPDGFSYFFPPEDGGFITVDEATPFYIREDGVPVVVFPKYSIAAGAAGFPEFPIDGWH